MVSAHFSCNRRRAKNKCVADPLDHEVLRDSEREMHMPVQGFPGDAKYSTMKKRSSVGGQSGAVISLYGCRLFFSCFNSMNIQYIASRMHFF